MRCVLTLAIGLWFAAPRAALAQASVPSSPACLVLTFGPWLGDANPDHYTVVRPRDPSIIELRATPPAWFPNSRDSFDAHVVNGTGLRTTLWRWHPPDSVQLIATAALSDGWVLRGRFTGDTLRGRVVGTSDALGPNRPRADAFGFRIGCADTAAVRIRLADVQRWRASARADSTTHAVEHAAEAAWFRELERTGRIPDRPPPAP